MTSDLQNPSLPRLPSWSWMSADGEVTFLSNVNVVYSAAGGGEEMPNFSGLSERMYTPLITLEG